MTTEMVLGFVTCFLAVMGVCTYIVWITGSTEGLRDFAEVVRAFWDWFRR